MKDDTRLWMKYAEENVKSAKVLKENSLFNPCLQNIQQAVEKFLKAVIIEYGFEFRKTHSINELKDTIASHGITVDITKEECHFLDSVYLPSKYPISSALPDFEPDIKICDEYLIVADQINASVKEILKKHAKLE